MRFESQNGITNIIIVWHLHIIEDNHILQFCGVTDHASFSNQCISTYERTLKVKSDKNRAFVISEYGGYACHIPGHSSVDRIYGYRKYANPEELTTAYRQLLEKQLFPLVDKGLSGAVYTQLSDVEEEVNGLVTYDRKIVKIQMT